MQYSLEWIFQTKMEFYAKIHKLITGNSWFVGHKNCHISINIHHINLF